MTNLHAALICQQLVARAGVQLPTEQLQALFRFAAASQVSVNMRRRRRLQKPSLASRQSCPHQARHLSLNAEAQNFGWKIYVCRGGAHHDEMVLGSCKGHVQALCIPHKVARPSDSS